MEVKWELIPSFLLNLARWVGFRLTSAPGSAKPSKHPINATNGYFASSADPNTWTISNEVRDRMKRFDYTCAGFALGDGWAGIDIDHAYTDGVLHPAAQKIIDMFSFAYIERSVSGEGVHIYFRCEKPDYISFNKIPNFDGLGADLEIYFESRFFIVTGDRLGSGEVIPEDTEKTESGFMAIMEMVGNLVKKKSWKPIEMPTEIDDDDDEIALYNDDQLIQRATLLNGGKNLRALLSGDNPLKNGDASANDFATCGLLYMAGGTKKQIKRILKGSSRYRSKYDSTRASYGTWLDLTVVQAMAYVLANESNSEPANDAEKNDEPDELSEAGQTDLVRLPILFGNALELEEFGRIQAEDLDISLLFTKYCNNKLICTAGRKFLAWDGNVWQEGKHLGKNLAIDFVLELSDFVEKIEALPNKDNVQNTLLGRLKRLVGQLRSKTRIEAFLSLAEPKLMISDQSLDANWDLLNTPEGVIDLKTGVIFEAQPEYLFTQTTKCGIKATSNQIKIWSDFVHKFVDEDDEYAEFLKIFCGQFVLGKIMSEQVAFAIGGGGNGKSSFFNPIHYILGDYATMLDPEVMLVSKQNMEAKMMVLMGKRFALAAETEEGKRLSSAQLKKIASTDKMIGKKLYYDPVEFIPSHTTVLFTNHRPSVGSIDTGTWRRIILLPFNHDFRNDSSPVIQNFGQYLAENAGPAILSWLVEGAKKFLELGGELPPCKAVDEATKGYRTDENWVMRFVDDCLDVGGSSWFVGAQQMYNKYREWAQMNNEYPRRQSDFNEAFADQGFIKQNRRNYKMWVGVRIRLNDDDNLDLTQFSDPKALPF